LFNLVVLWVELGIAISETGPRWLGTKRSSGRQKGCRRRVDVVRRDQQVGGPDGFSEAREQPMAKSELYEKGAAMRRRLMI
jgi:hypothetical protein